MAAEAQGGERGAHSLETTAPPRRRVAEAVQAARRAEPIGDAAQLKAGGAILEAGGWIRGRCDFQDVCCEEQPVAWRVEDV
jgi:hypothetical protein